MTVKHTAPSPHGDSWEELVDRSATDTSEPDKAADEQWGDCCEERCVGEHGEPPGDNTHGQCDEQRGRHIAEQAGATECREPVAAWSFCSQGLSFASGWGT